jgi:hypothetical protein
LIVGVDLGLTQPGNHLQRVALVYEHAEHLPAAKPRRGTHARDGRVGGREVAEANQRLA